MFPQKMQNRYNPYWKVVGGKVGGHNTIGKGAVRSERVSSHTLTIVKFFYGWFVRNFVHLRADKSAKPLKPLFEGDGRVGRHMNDIQWCSE